MVKLKDKRFINALTLDENPHNHCLIIVNYINPNHNNNNNNNKSNNNSSAR